MLGKRIGFRRSVFGKKEGWKVEGFSIADCGLKKPAFGIRHSAKKNGGRWRVSRLRIADCGLRIEKAGIRDSAFGKKKWWKVEGIEYLMPVAGCWLLDTRYRTPGTGY